MKTVGGATAHTSDRLHELNRYLNTIAHPATVAPQLRRPTSAISRGTRQNLRGWRRGELPELAKYRGLAELNRPFPGHTHGVRTHRVPGIGAQSWASESVSS